MLSIICSKGELVKRIFWHKHARCAKLKEL